jgi:FkbM family methyltransferase
MSTTRLSARLGRLVNALASHPRLRARVALLRTGDARGLQRRLDPTLVAAANTWIGVLPGAPRTVVDVGASTGDYARQLAVLYGPTTSVLIEPIPELAERLRGMTLAGETHVFCCAAGGEEAVHDLHVFAHSPASSLLEAATGLGESYGVSLDAASVHRVPVRPLDDLLAEAGVTEVDLLKIDVQGYELEVLRGATKTLAATRWLFIEVSMIEHYKGQPLFDSLMKWLGERGFLLATTHNAAFAADGRPLHCDALFLNTRHSAGGTR